MIKGFKWTGWASVCALSAAAALYGCASAGDETDQALLVDSSDTQRVDPRELPAQGTVDATKEQAIVAAARAALPSYFDQVEAAELENYGFSDTTELRTAQFGAPYEYFALLDSGDLQPLERWSVPVTVNGEARAFVDVKLTNGRYRAYAFGSAQLAKEIGRAEVRHTTSGAAPIVARSIIRSFRHAADFVSYETDLRVPKAFDQVRARALDSARVALGERAQQLPVASNLKNLRAPLDAGTLRTLLAP